MIVFAGTKTIVDSGPPPDQLATGTAISVDQHAAIYLPFSCNCTLSLIQFYISNPYQDNKLELSLCTELDFKGKKRADLLDTDTTLAREFEPNCIHGSVLAPQAKRIHIEWKANIELQDRPYWFVVKG
jgi:hypothetical protein